MPLIFPEKNSKIQFFFLFKKILSVLNATEKNDHKFIIVKFNNFDIEIASSQSFTKKLLQMKSICAF